jgi:hypothetical protein
MAGLAWWIECFVECLAHACATSLIPTSTHICAGLCIVSVVVDLLVSIIDSHNLRWLLSRCWMRVWAYRVLLASKQVP